MDKWREEDATIERAIPMTMVAREMDKPRDTFMLVRGEYDKKGDKAEPGVPAILPPWPDGAPTNRLGLARWLVDPSHPLTARVTVNRFWQQYFGTGLVKTTEDFGVQGEHPSHPELLDWLATEFIRSGWDVKRMQTLIVTSATYRQILAGIARRCCAAIRRIACSRAGRASALDAEVVRDTALVVSGLLVEQAGRTQRQALRAARPVGGGLLQQFAEICAGQGRRPLSPQPVHLLEAAEPAAQHAASSTRPPASIAWCAVRAPTRRCRRWRC